MTQRKYILPLLFIMVVALSIAVFMQKNVLAQTTGGNTSTPSRYVFGTVYQGDGSTPLSFASVQFRGDASFSQKANNKGGFSFIVKPGHYSVWASATGYQSNVCFFDVDKDPVEVTFALGKLNVASSSCKTSIASSSEIPIESRDSAQDTVGDGTGGPDPTGTGSTGHTNSNSTNTTGTTTVEGGKIVSKSNCVVTKIGNPTGSATLPAECQTGTEVPVGPGVSCQQPASYPGDLKVAIKNRFGIDFLNFDQEHLKWFWEELWNTSGTKFTALAKGAVVTADFCPGGGNFSCYVGGCRGVQQDGASGPNLYFGSYQGETFNKTLIVHELGHYIMGCADEVNASFLSEFDQADAAEGGVTYYAQNSNACAGGGVSNHNEDFAETIAYYLHPNSLSQSINCGPNNGAPNPFYGTNGVRTSSFTRHFAWAQKALGVFACSGSSTIKQ